MKFDEEVDQGKDHVQSISGANTLGLPKAGIVTNEEAISNPPEVAQEHLQEERRTRKRIVKSIKVKRNDTPREPVVIVMRKVQLQIHLPNSWKS